MPPSGDLHEAAHTVDINTYQITFKCNMVLAEQIARVEMYNREVRYIVRLQSADLAGIQSTDLVASEAACSRNNLSQVGHMRSSRV